MHSDPVARVSKQSPSSSTYANTSTEYIGSLEGDLQAKADETTALRTENRQLREENNRLTDLTRMLLSSQAFSGFLQELNQSGLPEHSRQPSRQERASQPQPTRKDINPHEAGRQFQSQQPQIGMALVPEPSLDMSLFDTPSWNPVVPSTDYHVFAVTEVPQGPVPDLTACSEKSEKPSILSAKIQKMVPALSEIPEKVQKAVVDSTVEAADIKAPATSSAPYCKLTPVVSSSTSPHLTKPNSKSTLGVHLVNDNAQASPSGSWEHSQAMCLELNATAKRLALIVPDLL